MRSLKLKLPAQKMIPRPLSKAVLTCSAPRMSISGSQPSGPPGAQILEAFLVAIGPVFGGKATSIWRVGEDRSYVRGLLAVPLRMRRRVDPAEQPRQWPPGRFRQGPGEHSLHRQARHLVDVLCRHERPCRRGRLGCTSLARNGWSDILCAHKCLIALAFCRTACTKGQRPHPCTIAPRQYNARGP